MYNTKTRSNYLIARSYVIDIIDDSILFKNYDQIGYRFGVIDITAAIDFQMIATDYDLTPKQYENLINYAQKYAEKQLH